MTPLPINDALPDLLEALRAVPNAVLVAPPGAGKTTAVAPALLDQSWCTGQILLLSPRRLAARAAAERIAELTGAPLGGAVGYATRLDSRHGPATRILVITAGIFRNRIIADPELMGVSAVLFDEVHERSIDSDFGLALALEAQSALRPDLRIVAMSATLDGARFARLLGDAPVIESAGRAHPVTLHHIGRDAGQRLETAMARAIRGALIAEPQGDLLAFLPGVRDIDRTADALEGSDFAVVPLHGTLDPAAQRRAIRPDPDGRRKVILATAIAESSLTIDGVRLVVDAGLARRARYDAGAGLTRLVTERASLASVTQRAGRAGRQAPGHVWRLWEAAANGGLPAYDPPEILEADLAPLLLDCAAWGARDPARLAWLDPPPVAALAVARAQLVAIAAITDDGVMTAHGRTIAALPLPPALAHMLRIAAGQGCGALGAEVAVLLSEQGLGGRGDALDARLERWRHDRGPRADAARGLARRLASMAGPPHEQAGDLSIGALVALAFPDRLARRRDARGEQWHSVGGRGFSLDAASPLVSAIWLSVADVQGDARAARIRSAAQIGADEVAQLFADRVRHEAQAHYDRANDRIVADRVERLGALVLRRQPDGAVSPDRRAEIICAAIREQGLVLVPFGVQSAALRARAAYAGLTQLLDAGLLATLGQWLGPLVATSGRLGQLTDTGLQTALITLLAWDEAQRLERLAPATYRSPAGSTHAIDYAADAGPTVTLRVQAVFGATQHPCVGQPPVPLVLSLTSPAGRPIQTTRDLPGFWQGSWSDVRRDLRGRYPRHSWPENPAAAAATLRTKRADARQC